MNTISNNQIRAARALLGLHQSDVAKITGMEIAQLSKYENGKSDLHPKTKSRLVLYFQGNGIEFTPNDGIRRTSLSAITLEGKEGFAHFRKDVLHAIHQGNADICISNLDEREFDKWGEGEVNDKYRNEMAEIRQNNPDLKFRSLVKKGDTHLSAARHSDYKWIDPRHFADIPFYIYGDKTAMLLFEDDNINIVVINHPKLTAFYRKQFNAMWDNAEILTIDPLNHIPKKQRSS